MIYISIVAVDLDNTINNFVYQVIDCINQKYNKTYTIQDIIDYDICQCLQISSDEIQTITQTSEFLNSLKPLNDVSGYLNALNDIATIYIVTARSCFEMLDVSKWFSTHLPFIQDNQIVRCIDKSIIDADILIDDSLYNILNFPRGRILFNYPYNINYPEYDYNSMIYRVNNWEECFNTCCLMLGYNNKQIIEKINIVKKGIN